jgi:hypothetical protein
MNEASDGQLVRDRAQPLGRRSRRHGPRPKCRDIRLDAHRRNLFIRQQREFGNFAGRPKLVEEVDKRHARAVAGDRRDQGKVVRLLAGVAAQERAAGGATRHHILMVTEDRQPLRRERPRADVHREGQEFARDLVEIGDHQEQPLRCGERRGQRAAEQTAVHGARDAALGLQLHDARHLAPKVGFSGGRPRVAHLRHGRGWSDRIDGDQLVEPVGHGGHRLVGIARGVGGESGRAGHKMRAGLGCPEAGADSVP